MHYHLRLSSRSAGEIQQEIVGHLIALRHFKWVCLVESAPIVVPSVRHIRSYRDAMADGRAVSACLLHVIDNDRVATSHDTRYSCHVATVDDILIGKHVCSRYSHCSELMQSQHGVPPFESSLENQHYSVASFDSYALQERGTLVADILQSAVCDIFFSASIVYPNQCVFLRLLSSVSVNDVVTEIEILRYVYLKIAHEVLIG